jgi:outer membrane protein TolC
MNNSFLFLSSGIKYPFPKFLFPFLLVLVYLGTSNTDIFAQKRDSLPINKKSKNLDDFLGMGLKNSPLLNENQNLFFRSQLDSAKIKAGQKPQISLGSTAQYYPSFGSYGYNQAISNGGNYLATIGFTQPLFNRYLIKTQINSIQIKKDSLKNSGKISLLEIKRSIINQYILSYADFRQIQFQNEILDLYLEQEGIFKKLVQKGIFKQSDYLTFLVSRQAQEIAITQSRISFHNNLSQLNSLCGIADSTTYDLEKPKIERGNLRPLHSTFQYHKFEVDSLSLLGQRDIIASAYRPKINWFADAGYESPNFYQFYKSFGASIGISLSLSLYDGHQRRIMNKQLDLDERTRLGYLNFFKNQYQEQILNLEKQLSDLELLEAQLDSQIKNNQTLVDIDKKLLNIGDLKINDLILAINNYKSLQFYLTQVEVNRLSILNQLNFWSTQY